MTTSVTDDRARFEAWISDPMEGGAFFVADDADLRLDHEGEYEDSLIFGAWIAWQAALRSQGEVVSVEKLKALVARMDKVDQMLTEGEIYSSIAVEDIVYAYQLDLTAIIGEGD